MNYGVRRDDARIDFDEVARLAKEHLPKMIIAGGSAYPRKMDHAKFREIASGVLPAQGHADEGAARLG